MADLARTIQIIFEAVDDTAAGFRSVTDKVGAFAGSVEQATQPLADIAQGILAADAAVIALGAAMIKFSTDEAGKFQLATREINTLIGLSPELMDQFTDDILAYGATSTQTFAQINQSVYDAISAGVDYEDALDAVRIAEQLAVAGKADLNESLNLLVPTLNAYGAGIEEAGQYSDVFFTTVRLGKTTIPELAASLGQLAPTAAAVGVPIETIGAALATLTANGIGTSEATTGLKAALSNIIKPSGDAQKAAEELNVAFGVSALRTEGLEGLLQQLYTATGGNTEQMARFFGSTEALNAVLSLTSGESVRFTANLQAMESATGATEAAYRIMAGSLEAVNVQLGNAVDAVLIKLGSELLPRMSEISGGLRDVFAGIGEGLDDGAFDVPIGIVQQFLGDIAELLRTAAANLPEALALVDWSRFEDSFDGVRDAVSGLFDGVDIGTPQGLADVIQALVDTFAGFIEVSAGVIEGIEPLLGMIGALVGWFADLSPEAQRAAGYLAGLGLTINTVAGTVVGLAGALGGASGLVGVMAQLGPAIAGASVAFAGFTIGEKISEVTGFQEASERWLLSLRGIPEVIGPADSAVERSVATLAGLARELGVSSLSMDDFNAAVESGKLVWDDTTQKWVTAETAARNLGSSFEAMDTAELVAQFNALSGELQITATGTETLTAAQYRYRDGTLQMLDATGQWVETSWDAFEVSGQSADALEEQTAAVQRQADEQRILNEASTEYLLGWQKILSEERVAIFELAADIRVAEIEADAQRTVAAFDSMARSFESTGQVLTELFGIWSGMDSIGDRSKVEDWINREYAIREKLAEGQLSLVEAEVRRIAAQTALLERGGVAVNISADGLDPALEAFMFTVLDKVRVQIAGDYTDFLLGCGS